MSAEAAVAETPPVTMSPTEPPAAAAAPPPASQPVTSLAGTEPAAATKPVLTDAELQDLLLASKRKREKRCWERIDAILKEENCLIEAEVHPERVGPGRVGITASPVLRAL